MSGEKILGKGGVNSETATLLPFAGLAAVKALDDSKVDVVWIIGSPDATAVKSLLGIPKVRLLGFPMAEAFARIYPDLVRLLLPKGVVDIDRAIPSEDVPLIGTTSKVLVRSDLHPEIVQLLLQTMGRRIVDENFQRSGEFPNGTDAEYPVAATAIDFYKKRPFVHAAAFASMALRPYSTSDRCAGDRHRNRPAAIPLSTPALQMEHAPASALLVGQLKALEASFDASPSDKYLAEMQAAIERIEDAVSHIRFPLTFTDQLYNLRSHIDIVRRKITARANVPGRMAAAE